MPHTVAIDQGRRLIYSRFWGRVERADFEQVRAVVRQHPRFDPTFDVLVDLRQADMLRIAGMDILGLASSPMVLGPTAKRAVVTDTDDQFGMARMYQAHLESAGCGHRQTRVYKTLPDAFAWLGLEAFDPITMIDGDDLLSSRE